MTANKQRVAHLCGHKGCTRVAVRIVGLEAPKHKGFLGQTHDCCAVHSRGVKK